MSSQSSIHLSATENQDCEQYAVFGNPIAHSQSPFIHQQFAEQCQQAMTYRAILAAKDGFEMAIRQFIAQGGKGANITTPFKEEAYQLCDQLTEAAQYAEAVNTFIVQPDGTIYGDTTDGIGLVTDLARHLDLTNKKVLLLGAGGAAKGCILPLLNAGVSELVIYNRTLTKAQALAARFADFGTINACTVETLADDYQLIINATSAGLYAQEIQLPVHILADDPVCYDMTYKQEVTPFNQWAMENGASYVLDGLGMLVEQAAQSFKLWRGIHPETEIVLKALRHQL